MQGPRWTGKMSALVVAAGLALLAGHAGCAEEPYGRRCYEVSDSRRFASTWRQHAPPWRDAETDLMLRTWVNAIPTLDEHRMFELMADELTPDELLSDAFLASGDLVLLADEYLNRRYAEKHGRARARRPHARALEAHLECRNRHSLAAQLCPWIGLHTLSLGPSLEHLTNHALPKALGDERYAFALLDVMNFVTGGRDGIGSDPRALHIWTSLRDAPHLVDASQAAAAAIEEAIAEDVSARRRRAPVEATP